MIAAGLLTLSSALVFGFGVVVALVILALGFFLFARCGARLALTAAAVLSLAMCLLSGCAHQVSTVAPAPPQTPYQKAAVYIDDFSAGLVQAQQVLLMLHQQKYIDDPTNRTIEATFAQIAQKGAAIDTLLAANADAATIADAINANSAALDSIVASGSAGIKDATTQKTFTATIGALKLLLQGALLYIKPTATSEVIYGRGSHSPGSRNTAAAGSAGVFSAPQQVFYRDAADDRSGDRGRTIQFSEGRAGRGQRRVVLA